MNAHIWTKKQKKEAHDAILEDYNFYEVKPVKFLKSIIFQSNGVARKIGHAHDYSYNINN